MMDENTKRVMVAFPGVQTLMGFSIFGVLSWQFGFSFAPLFAVAILINMAVILFVFRGWNKEYIKLTLRWFVLQGIGLFSMLGVLLLGWETPLGAMISWSFAVICIIVSLRVSKFKKKLLEEWKRET